MRLNNDLIAYIELEKKTCNLFFCALQYKQSPISFVVNIIFPLIKLSMLKVKPLLIALPT